MARRQRAAPPRNRCGARPGRRPRAACLAAYPADAGQDDTLAPLFLCCHPALAPGSPRSAPTSGWHTHTHRLEAVRAHLLDQAGDTAAGRDAYLRAAKLTASLPEQRYLELRAAQLHDLVPPASPPGRPDQAQAP